MPDDLDRYRTLQRDAIRVAAFWLAVAAAAQDCDKVSAWQACEKIQTLTKTAFAIVKSLGTGGKDA